MPEPLTPTCPRCHQPPIMAFCRQAFCPTDDCDVFTWDPFKTAEEFEATARPLRVTDAEGNPVDWPGA